MDYDIEIYSYLRDILLLLRDVEHSEDYIVADCAMEIKDDLEDKLRRMEERMGVDCTFVESCRMFMDMRSVDFLVERFTKWADRYGYRKHDRRRKDNSHTFRVSGSCYDWHKVECEVLEDGVQAKLRIIMRKESGLYLIIEYEGTRMLEIDYNGPDGELRIMRDREDDMWRLYSEYRALFDALGISPIPTTRNKVWSL